MNTIPLLVSGLTAMTAVGAVIVDHGIHRRSAKLLTGSVFHGPGHRRSVALTFDDGPSAATPQLLAFLREEGIRATFFMCGMNVERHPEIVRQVFREGHEIGNHTFTHPRLRPQLKNGWRLPSPRKMYRELATTQRLLTDLCKAPPRVFRAPYGESWVGLRAVHARMGMRDIHWSVIGHDWEWPAERIARHTLAACKPGGIICLHDGRDVQTDVDLSEMMAALRILVPALRERGFSFETVSDLLQPNAAYQPAHAS